MLHTADWNLPLTPQVLYTLVNVVLGVMFPVVGLTIGLLALFFWRRIESKETGWSRPVLAGLSLSALLCVTVGLWVWLVFAAVSQVRYFTPFALIAFIYIVPLALRLLQVLPRWGQVVLQLVSIAPACGLAVLLLQSSPSQEWQEKYGINIA